MQAKRTNHSDIRMKDRMNLNKSAKQKKADTAFEKGISCKDAKGSLKKYFDYLYLHNPKGHAGQIRIYGREVYIFLNDGTLKTVLPLPHQYNNIIDNIMKKKREGELV